MNSIDLLNFIEEGGLGPFANFTDIHIINNQVVGFYKTKYVLYEDKNGKLKSYLFPTTFEMIGNRIKTTMIFGSVERNFQVEEVNGTGDNTSLKTINVGNHIYKLLVAEQYEKALDKKIYNYPIGFRIKPFVAIIESLSHMKFPFMRITNNDAIDKYSDIY